MTPALVGMAGGLVLLSGLGKLRASRRGGPLVLMLSVLEICFGMIVAFLAMAAPPSPSLGMVLVVGGVVLVLASSAVATLKLAAARRAREASEGARLATYIRYLSARDGGSPPEERGA